MFLTFIENYPFLVAFLLGIIPAFIWLWFWLKEDRHPEPAKMLTLAFLGGIISVLIVLPIQKLVYDYLVQHKVLSFTLWAGTEEVIKFLVIYFIALKRKVVDEPVDDIIYLIVGALGFVTFENTLFLNELIKDGDFISTLINGNMRFMGASLIHIISSATIGFMLALSFYKKQKERIIYTIIGIILAIVLHTSFNLFIISEVPGNIFFIFGMVWIGIVVLLLLFEKIKHLKKEGTNIKL
ncbi:MAG TPA: PrsW family glutamic-type intramembrane protease [Parcubacteria group bacterium]|jgi:RsiW-degrading membrane proteinase PrsW (M82 family)|nr:PrsW family glutamic-type intramembrane protease [Parcubacteria group bacterium]